MIVTNLNYCGICTIQIFGKVNKLCISETHCFVKQSLLPHYTSLYVIVELSDDGCNSRPKRVVVNK
jgi:hypothetical protein